MEELLRGLRARFLDQAGAAFDGLMAWEEEHGESRLLHMEEEIKEQGTHVTRAMLEAVLIVRKEAEKSATDPVCPECEEPMRYKGHKKKRLVTTVGEVDWERSHYYCEGCKSGVFPPRSEVRDQERGVE